MDNNTITVTLNVHIEELKKLFDFTKYGNKVRFFKLIGEKQRSNETYDVYG